MRWCLLPGRARSTGEGPVCPPLEHPDVRAIDGRVVHLQQALLTQFRQQDLVQPRPDARFGPVPQTPPGLHPTAPDLFCGNVPPAHALAQHVNDARNAARSSTGRRPGYRRRLAGRTGNSGAMRSQRSSGTRSADTRQILPTQHPTTKPPHGSHSEMISYSAAEE